MPPAYLDSSALVVILNEEPGFVHLKARIKSRGGKLITSPIGVYEAVTALAGPRPTSDQLDKEKERVSDLLDELGVEIAACDAASLGVALDHYFQIVSQNRFVGEAPPFILGSSFAFATSNQSDAEMIQVGNPFLE